MRLAVFSDLVYRRHDGALWADEAFALFAARLGGAGRPVVLVGRLDPTPAPSHHRLPGGVELVELPHYDSLAARRAPAVLARSLGRLWHTLGDVDGVWLLGPHPLAIAFAVLAAVRRRRVVLGVRQHLPDYVRARRPGRRGLLLAALALEASWRALARVFPVVVVGPDLAHRYRHARRLLDLPISLVDEADIASADEAHARVYDGDLVALSVGRLDAEKNPLLLADALAALRRRDPRWQLVVCGDGGLREALRARLRELGVDAHAELRGNVPFDRLLETYRSSHALLHVSWTEGFPQVLIEAFAAGLPVVATAVGGVAEVAGGAALLIGPGDAPAAAAALERLREDPALRRRHVMAGREVAARHTVEAIAERVVRFTAG